MKQDKKFSFNGILEKIEGIYKSFGIFVPEKILSELPQKGRFRTQGTMNGVPFNLAILSAKERGKYFVISAGLKKAIQANEDDTVSIQFELVSSEMLDIPEEFHYALEQDPEGNAVFSTFTTGMKRGLMHYVSSAKSSDTRIKRSLELLEKMKTQSLYSQKLSKTGKK